MIKAIVTGHSQGLGEGIAAALLEQGIAVLGLARGAAPALAARFPAQLQQQALDLGDGAALQAWLAGPALAAFLHGCTSVLLVNNAGTVQPVGALAVQAPDAVLRAVAINVGAPLALSAAVVRARGEAACRVLHVSSGAAATPYAGWSVYCATKAALDQHARACALDADPAVRVVSLAPGVLDTAMQGEIRAASAQQFPSRQRFVALKTDGGLRDPADAGRLVAAYLLAEDFGRLAVDDVRRTERPPA